MSTFTEIFFTEGEPAQIDTSSLLSSVVLDEDEPAHAALIARALEGVVGEVQRETTGACALKAVQETYFELVLADLNLPDITGMQLLREVIEARPGLPVLVMTASINLDDAVQAMREGAWDYMVKQFDANFKYRVRLLIERAAQRKLQQMRENQVRAERDAFWSAAATAQDGLAIVGRNGDVYFSNEAFNKFAVLLRQSMSSPNANLFELVAAHDAATAKALRSQLSQTRAESLSSTELKVQVPQADGTSASFFFELTLSIVQPEIRSFAIDPAAHFDLSRNVIWVHDVTQRKEQEKFNRDILATTTHDLKGPLGAVLNSAELVLEESLSEEQRGEMVTRIASCARSCITIIDELLSARRIQDGVFVISPRWYPAYEILDDLVLDYLPTAKAKRITYSARPTDRSLTVFADRLGLNRVLTNLVSNALKFTPSGGRVEISAKSIDGAVQFYVADTGPGIELKARHLLFKRYSRLESHREIEGTGLGLFIAKNIVDAHNGQLEVKSTIGQGTTFIVTIPNGRLENGHAGQRS